MVEFVTDIVIASEWKWTPAQVLDSETRYPGLIEDIFLVAWQRALVDKQLNDEGNEPDTP